MFPLMSSDLVLDFSLLFHLLIKNRVTTFQCLYIHNTFSVILYKILKNPYSATLFKIMSNKWKSIHIKISHNLYYHCCPVPNQKKLQTQSILSQQQINFIPSTTAFKYRNSAMKITFSESGSWTEKSRHIKDEYIGCTFFCSLKFM